MHTLIDHDGHAYWCACRLDFDHDHAGEKVPDLGGRPTLRPV
jgi:hypothetical protein